RGRLSIARSRASMARFTIRYFTSNSASIMALSGSNSLELFLIIPTAVRYRRRPFQRRRASPVRDETLQITITLSRPINYFLTVGPHQARRAGANPSSCPLFAMNESAENLFGHE